MIIHIFNTKMKNLVPSISKGFASVYSNDASHFFILYEYSQLDKQLYISQFSQIGFDNYVFCKSYTELVKLLIRHRKDTILFHAGKYSWHLTALLLGCKNINWVCWGGGTTISKNIKSQCGAIIKQMLFKRFRTIVTLMEPERMELIKNYAVNPRKVKTISYTSTNDNESKGDLFCKELSNNRSINSENLIVLLGNSPYCLNSYLAMLPRLQQYKGKIIVHCMLNYPFEKGDKYYTLIERGKSLFGDDFKTDEEFYSNRKEYIKYMNKCDIYICTVEKQTGLGAISACLRLGKKIYITGNNLEWVRQEYKSIVFPSDMINAKLCFDEFAKPLTTEEKQHNYHNRVICKAVNRERWHNYLKEIDSSYSQLQ